RDCAELELRAVLVGRYSVRIHRCACVFRHLTYCWPTLGQAISGIQMKFRMKRWLLGLAMLFVFAGFYTPPQAEAAVGVVVVVRAHRTYHRRYHRRYYHRRYVRRYVRRNDDRR